MSSYNRAPYKMTRQEYYSCWRKFCLPNYLEAMIVARKSHYPYITTYPCEYCGYFHIGRSHFIRKQKRRLDALRKLLRNKGFLMKAPRAVIDQTIERIHDILDQYPEIKIRDDEESRKGKYESRT